MSFEAIVVDPLDEALPEGWDRLVLAAGLSSLWRSQVLATLAWYERYRPIVALVQDSSGEPCAAFCARHVRMPAGRASFHDPRRRPMFGFLEFHLPPMVTTAGHAFHPALDRRERQAAVLAAERALGERLGLACRGFAYRQVATDDLPAFRSGAHITLAASPDEVVEIRWRSFDAYLADLPGQDRRELARIRRIVDRDETLEIHVGASLRSTEASRLAHVVRMRYRPRFRVAMSAPAAFYDRLSALEGVRFITYRERSGELQGFGVLADDGVGARSLLWGARERADGGRANLYFDHFLREVEYCIANGRRRLVMGKGLSEIKRRFGAKPVELYTAARLRPLTHRRRSP